jgi:hypothetical protein
VFLVSEVARWEWVWEVEEQPERLARLFNGSKWVLSSWRHLQGMQEKRRDHTFALNSYFPAMLSKLLLQ